MQNETFLHQYGEEPEDLQGFRLQRYVNPLTGVEWTNWNGNVIDFICVPTHFIGKVLDVNVSFDVGGVNSNHPPSSSLRV